MTGTSEWNKYGEEMENLLRLRTAPIAVQMLEREEDIPAGAVRPNRDNGNHIAQCQAFAMSRRDRATVAMLKEDHWCFAPLIAYGLVDKPDDPAVAQFTTFPTLERGKYIGMLTAPLSTAEFEPDVVLIYSNTAQLRHLLLPLSYGGKKDQVDYDFFPPGCAQLIVPVMENGRYMVALPDPGDYMRALAGEDEIILAAPAQRLGELVEGLQRSEEMGMGYTRTGMFMQADFPRPDFYKDLFEKWGLDRD